MNDKFSIDTSQLAVQCFHLGYTADYILTIKEAYNFNDNQLINYINELYVNLVNV